MRNDHFPTISALYGLVLDANPDMLVLFDKDLTILDIYTPIPN